MSFLAEVLSCAEQVELKSINKEVPKLKQLITKLKKDVMEYTERIFIKFEGRPTQTKNLLTKACSIEKELKTLQKNANNLIKKNAGKIDAELEKNIVVLKEVDLTLKIVMTICEFNEKLILFGTYQENKQYLKCMKLIDKLETEVNEVPKDESLYALEELKQTIDDNRNYLLRDLTSIFKESVQETQIDRGIILKLKRDLHELQEGLMALYYFKPVIYCLHTFAKSLWNNYFIPIVDKTVKIDILNTDTHNILTITIMELKKSSYNNVFSNLQLLLEFLKSNFNLKLAENISTLKYIGEDVGDNVSELIIKHCLQDTIPSTAEELHNYRVVIEDTEKLETVLRSCGIFKEDTASILKYANNIDIHFINKKCQTCNSAAEWIMKKDLYDMTEVGVPYNPEKPMEVPNNELLACSVSKSAIELMQFVDKIMQQAINASDICAGRLFCTVKNIVFKYGQFVPQYHSKLLQTIPQQVALFHNNCWYISYELNKMNKTYSAKLSSKLDTSCCGFKEEINQLQIVAVEHFNNYVTGQIKQIQEIMSESGLEGPLLDNLDPKTEKCIRQCLRQQEILKTVWHKVLAYPIYNRTLGIILDSLCTKIITTVTKYEDIPSNIAEQLVEIIKLVLTRGPKLFSDAKEVGLFVKSWHKLNELNFVLGASLVDINDRWADGKGPLALQFTGLELRVLVRALFQNTDRRAALLSRILD